MGSLWHSDMWQAGCPCGTVKVMEQQALNALREIARHLKTIADELGRIRRRMS